MFDPTSKNPSIANRQSKKYILHSVGAQTSPAPAPLFFSGRAGNACTNLLGFFVCCVRTRGMVKTAESARLSAFTLSFAARTRHAWLARLTRARGGCFLRGRKILLNDFWYFWSLKSTKKEKLLYVKDNTSSTAIAVPLLPLEKALYPLFLLHMQAQKKKLSKRKRRWGDFALCGVRPPLSVDDTAF